MLHHEVDGADVRGVEYDMEDCLWSKIDQYLDLVEKTTGQRPRITSAVTPFFPESPMHNRAAVPFKPGKAVICHMFSCAVCM